MNKNPTDHDSAASLSQVLTKIDQLLDRFMAPENDWSAPAYRWRKRHLLGVDIGYLQPIARPHRMKLADLVNIEEQKILIEQNTRQFIEGLPANNVLLTGSRGTGKSSLIKALLNEYQGQGLRLIEIDREDVIDLPEITALIADRPERFIVFCDDLSFETQDRGYKALKVALDGSIESVGENMLIYATSNRRHLVPEYFEENAHAQYKEGEIHPADAVEEKISLSERFGLWLSFYPFNQEEYWAIAAGWLAYFGLDETTIEAAKPAALRWALQRGSRSGRVAWQFARHYAGSIPSHS